jgi:tetratricopeptide (TPR) repeat protein
MESKRHWSAWALALFAVEFAVAGCKQEAAVSPAEKHDQIYQQGCDLIVPYMHVHGQTPRPANSDAARSELKRGIELLQEAIELNPENSSAYWIMGKAYQSLRDTERACDAFGKAFSIRKDHPDFAREYMLECLNLGRTADAVEAAEYAVRLDPENAGPIANLAAAYLFAGRVDQSLQTVERSLEIAPSDEITLSLKTIILEVKDGKRPQPKTVLELEGA